jgi:hypothetical protein
MPFTLFAAAAQILCGRLWQRHIAQYLDIPERTVRTWVSGVIVNPRISEDKWRALSAGLKAKARSAQQVADDIDRQLEAMAAENVDLVA